MIQRIKTNWVPRIKQVKLIVWFYFLLKRIESKASFQLKKVRKQSYISKSRLINDLKRAGIRKGDVVVVNSSMSSIGLLEGGGNTFVRALMEIITEDGLIVMPAYPHRGMYKYLKDYKIFDLKNTPSMNGVITECFRNTKGVYRTLHPTHSLCIWGKSAKVIAQGHEKSISPYDENSPYKKMLDLNAKNLCVGVNFDHMIMIRVIDDLYDKYPVSMYFDNLLFEVPVKNEKGAIIWVKTRCHDPEKSLQRNNMKLFPYLKDHIKKSRIGLSESFVIESKILFETQVHLSKQGVFPFYKIPYKKIGDSNPVKIIRFEDTEFSG